MNNAHTQNLISAWINLKAVEKTRYYLDSPYIEMITVVDELTAYIEPYTYNKTKIFSSYTPDFYLKKLYQGLKGWQSIMKDYDNPKVDPYLKDGLKGLFESHCEVSYWNFKRQLFDKINLAFPLLIEFDRHYSRK